MALKSLSADQCTLLAVQYASEANIQALHTFTPARPDVLDPELILRILLTFLPETVEPRLYTTYVREVASRLYLDVERKDVEVDLSSIEVLSAEQARKQVKSLNLLKLDAPVFPPHAPEDVLTRFLCCRSYRIEAETGSLPFISQLVAPFLDGHDFLRTWYISVVLPALRLNFEYYPEEEASLTMPELEKMDGRDGVQYLLTKTLAYAGHDNARPDEKSRSNITRDVKGLVGPWLYGHSERKRRKVDREADREANREDKREEEHLDEELAARTRKISLSGVSEDDITGHDWEYVYEWAVKHAEQRFDLITQLVDGWDGPSDLDFGGYQAGRPYLDYDTLCKLESQYAQAAFASCYAAQADDEVTIRGAHAILARLAELLDFIPPPDLATSIESLPKIERHAAMLEESRTLKDLEPSALLSPEHPLTTPRMNTYMLLQMMVYSAYQLAGLGHKLSIVSVAKLQFYSSAEEQLTLLKTILKDLSNSGRKDDAQWAGDRAKLTWLWSWGIAPDDQDTSLGAGVLGKINKTDFETEVLKALVDTSCYGLATTLISTKSDNGTLSPVQAESLVYEKVMQCYDSASNGNRTRGSMKKANDILVAFRKVFPQSEKLHQAAALIAATHALSFYSLTLQHGVPFQPVNIRVSKDPLELIDKVLAQNARSFTQLDDLIGVASNLVSAGLVNEDEDDEPADTASSALRLEKQRKDASRRVTFMAVEAALREDDFETAYSYIINRLTPSNVTDARPPAQPSHARNASTNSTASKAASSDDDISWRAAYLAGRYRPSSNSPPSLRRFEQRTELLSLALLLAPTTALTDILAAWRRCEEETSALQTAEQQALQEFDDRADRREPSTIPGKFNIGDEQPQLMLNQKRREVGRMAGSRLDGEAETPLSMFDLTRSAARAFSRNVNLGQATGQASHTKRDDSVDLQRSDDGEDAQQKVRRRDMVANAVSGGLANGIGWVLGAKPVTQQRQ